MFYKMPRVKHMCLKTYPILDDKIIFTFSTKYKTLYNNDV